MKNIFNFLNKKSSSSVSAETKELKHIVETKNMSEIIEEIHETFSSEVDRILTEAKISKSSETDKQELIDKCERLKKIGFTNTKEVKDAELEISRITKIQSENNLKAELIKSIDYFSFKYPNYKFITEDSVKMICQKYNLIYGSSDKYIGTFPTKNLKDIENFKIDSNDYCYIEQSHYRGSKSLVRFLNKSIIELEKSKEIERLTNAFSMPHIYSSYNLTTLCPMEIAAPKKDFNMTNSEIKDFKISDLEILDPVVLQPVFHNGNKYFLIVTMWGLEASDELVVNQKMN